MAQFERVTQLQEDVNYPAGFNYIEVVGRGDELRARRFPGVQVQVNKLATSSTGLASSAVRCVVTLTTYQGGTPFLVETNRIEGVSASDRFQFDVSKWIMSLYGAWEDPAGLGVPTDLPIEVDNFAGSRVFISSKYGADQDGDAVPDGLTYVQVVAEYDAAETIDLADGRVDEAWWLIPYEERVGSGRSDGVDDQIQKASGKFYADEACTSPALNGKLPIPNSSGTQTTFSVYYLPDMGTYGTAFLNFAFGGASATVEIQVHPGGLTASDINISITAEPTSLTIRNPNLPPLTASERANNPQISLLKIQATTKDGQPLTTGTIPLFVYRGEILGDNNRPRSVVHKGTVSPAAVTLTTTTETEYPWSDSATTFSVSKPIARIVSVGLAGPGGWRESASNLTIESGRTSITIPESNPLPYERTPLTITYVAAGQASAVYYPPAFNHIPAPPPPDEETTPVDPSANPDWPAEGELKATIFAVANNSANAYTVITVTRSDGAGDATSGSLSIAITSDQRPTPGNEDPRRPDRPVNTKLNTEMYDVYVTLSNAGFGENDKSISCRAYPHRLDGWGSGRTGNVSIINEITTVSYDIDGYYVTPGHPLAASPGITIYQTDNGDPVSVSGYDRAKNRIDIGSSIIGLEVRVNYTASGILHCVVEIPQDETETEDPHEHICEAKFSGTYKEIDDAGVPVVPENLLSADIGTSATLGAISDNGFAVQINVEADPSSLDFLENSTVLASVTNGEFPQTSGTVSFSLYPPQGTRGSIVSSGSLGTHHFPEESASVGDLTEAPPYLRTISTRYPINSVSSVTQVATGTPISVSSFSGKTILVSSSIPSGVAVMVDYIADGIATSTYTAPSNSTTVYAVARFRGNVEVLDENGVGTGLREQVDIAATAEITVGEGDQNYSLAIAADPSDVTLPDPDTGVQPEDTQNTTDITISGTVPQWFIDLGKSLTVEVLKQGDGNISLEKVGFGNTYTWTNVNPTDVPDEDGGTWEITTVGTGVTKGEVELIGTALYEGNQVAQGSTTITVNSPEDETPDTLDLTIAHAVGWIRPTDASGAQNYYINKSDMYRISSTGMKTQADQFGGVSEYPEGETELDTTRHIKLKLQVPDWVNWETVESISGSGGVLLSKLVETQDNSAGRLRATELTVAVPWSWDFNRQEFTITVHEPPRTGVDGSGERPGPPVANARVSLGTGDSYTDESGETTVNFTSKYGPLTTDDEGQVTFINPDPGEYWLLIQSDNHKDTFKLKVSGSGVYDAETMNDKIIIPERSREDYLLRFTEFDVEITATVKDTPEYRKLLKEWEYI